MPYKNPEDDKACRLRNRHKKLAYMKRYRSKNGEAEKLRSRAWYRKNRQSALAQQKQYVADNADKVKASRARTYQRRKHNPAYKAKMAENSKRWRDANPERAKATCRRYHRIHSEADANYIIKTRLRARLQKKLRAKGITKTASTEVLTGCTTDFLRGYLEARFLPGMTWANHGKWHIDHHIPCAEFDLREPAQQRQCFHYTNLKPMWGPDNIKKGAKRPAPHQAELI